MSDDIQALKTSDDIIKAVAQMLRCKPEDVPQRIEDIQRRHEMMREEIEIRRSGQWSKEQKQRLRDKWR